MWAALAATLCAQPVLRLKSGRTPAGVGKSESRAAAEPGPRHFLVQFAAEPTASQVNALRERGLAVLDAVPDFGYVVAGPGGADFSDTGVRWAGRIETADKFSPLLFGGNPLTAIVERHADVEMGELRLAALQEGLLLIDHPDLAPRHIMVQGSPAALWRMAARDEVSYVFPAAEDLLKGEPAIACLQNGAAAVSNLVASYGDGWDGPGLGAAQLSYWFGALTPALPRDLLRIEIERAMKQWSAAVRVDFTPAGAGSRPRSIDILFAAREHGDGFAFDGPGKTLAHTFYPPPNAEPLAGDLHMDLDESWRIGADYDVFSVALHELGHALGLAHSDDPNSVMYAYYRRATGLRAADIAAIRTLYASRDSSQTPTNPWQPPPVAPTLPQTPTQPAPPPPPAPKSDTTAPSLSITTPPASLVETTESAYTLKGTARDNVSVVSVKWSTTAGGGGSCAGTSQWATPPVALSKGNNFITIRAYDAAGNSGWRTVTIVRR